MPNNVKNKIADTFWRLTETKHIDKITVKDIVEICGISRQTFYYHFQDIIDVIEWTANREIQTMIVQCLNAKSQKDSIQQVVSFFFSHKLIWNKLLISKQREQFEKMTMNAIHKYIIQFIRFKRPDIVIDVDVEMKLYFLTYGLSGVFLEYANREDVTEEQFVQQICRLMENK